jgi:hypothetical protein
MKGKGKRQAGRRNNERPAIRIRILLCMAWHGDSQALLLICSSSSLLMNYSTKSHTSSTLLNSTQFLFPRIQSEARLLSLSFLSQSQSLLALHCIASFVPATVLPVHYTCTEELSASLSERIFYLVLSFVTHNPNEFPDKSNGVK